VQWNFSNNVPLTNASAYYYTIGSGTAYSWYVEVQIPIGVAGIPLPSNTDFGFYADIMRADSTNKTLLSPLLAAGNPLQSPAHTTRP